MEGGRLSCDANFISSQQIPASRPQISAMVAISLFSSSPSPCFQARKGGSCLLHSSSATLGLVHHFGRASVACSSRLPRADPVRRKKVRAVAEEGAIAPVADEEQPEEHASAANETVAVAVSPSDVLTMFFKAEGTMDDLAMSKVLKALQGKEAVSDLKVQNLEGIASVELTQQTTVQATGVASNLVEIIQGSGFKLQTLSLSFEDEEDAIS
ncbi:hypothetical protein AXF42_Ash005745 [Apostasia shenzhenica]|uniref:Uncharacterized protein n=1 Tax=Apostasia shenzhenica TaxID=1088818 RepID=A0A2I0BC97_9ASPA|nr:hypothetical protein AXF42_Ash005745 [Apostasia shenzhenica]